MCVWEYLRDFVERRVLIVLGKYNVILCLKDYLFKNEDIQLMLKAKSTFILLNKLNCALINQCVTNLLYLIR